MDGRQFEVTFTGEDGREHRVQAAHRVAGSGPTLVLVHGLMTSSYSWRLVIDDLARRYRVFAPDLVGSGDTDKPLALRYSVTNVARFLAAYVRAVAEEPVYLVGNSLGGLYCLRALLDAPDLARRYVHIHAPGYPMARMSALHALLAAPGLGVVLSEGLAAFTRLAPRWFVARNVHYATRAVSPEEAAEYGRLFSTAAGARVFARILRDSLDPREHARLVAELRAGKAAGRPFPCPVLVLYARQDALVPPAFGPRYAEDIAGATLRWMDGTSHFPQVDAPERTIAELLAFDGAASPETQSPTSA